MTIEVQAPRPAAGHGPYRADIDGLRAVAVLAVLFFHFGVPGTGGGYVGVDVFFVISGFLIGRSIVADVGAGRFSPLDFYARRIRRLYPAFLAMLALVTPVAQLLLLPSDLRSFGRSLVAALGSVSNIAFYKEHGYFDAGATTKPLLHTWSLAVEEQFYLLFPLLVWLATHWRARLLGPVLTAAGLLSLAAAWWVLPGDPAAAFYLFPYRAWELLAGVGLTFLVERAPPGPWRGGRHALGATGLLLILWPVVGYGPHTPFPALAAVPPCLGAACLILAGAGEGGGLANRALATAAPSFVGLISYSLYLWHWPLLVMLTFYVGDPLPAGWAAAGLAGSLLAGTLSWRWVEVPVRRSRRIGRGALFAGAALATLALGGVGFRYYRTDGLPGRFAGRNAALVAAADDFMQRRGTCVEADNPAIPGLAYCLLGKPGAAPSFLVWADSHGRAWRDGIDLAARERGVAGLLVWQGGCPPLFDTGKTELAGSAAENRACLAQNRRLGDLLAGDADLRTVILVGRWAYYTSGTGVGADAVNRVAPIDAAGRPVDFGRAMAATVARLRAQGRRVFVLEQVPEVPFSNARAIAQRVIDGRLALRQAVSRYARVDRVGVERRQAAAEALFRRLDVTVLPTHQLLCGRLVCSSWQGGAPVLFDNNHLTVAASERFRRVFAPALASAGG